MISGFLVTGIIERELAEGTFSLKRFYCRRIRRIFPAAAFVTAFVLLVGYRNVLPVDFAQTGAASIWQSFFVGNVFFWLDAGYFSRDVMTKPLLHFWSLAVEEQFYVVFPALLIILHKLSFQRSRLILFVAAIVVGSFALSIYGTKHHTSATFYLLPTRAWELGIGALIALGGWRIQRERLADFVGWLGTAMILVSIFAVSEASTFPGWVALLPTCGAGLVLIAGVDRNGTLQNLLSVRPLVFVGLISYSLYLWHWPLMAMTRYLIREPSVLLLAGVAVISIPIAWVSWLVIEQPIRLRRWFADDRVLLTMAGIVWGGLLVVSVWIHWYGGLPNRWKGEQVSMIEAANWTGNSWSRTAAQLRNGDIPMFGVPEDTVAPGGAPFLLWGDSHAMTWTELIDVVGHSVGRRGYAALHGGTPPLPGLSRLGMPDCKEFNSEVLQQIDRLGIRDVILVSRWSVYVVGYSDADPKADGRSNSDLYLSDTGPFGQSAEQSLDALCRSVKALAEEMKNRDVRVWLVRQVPVQSTVVAEAAVRNMLLGWELNEIEGTTRSAHQAQQLPIERFYSTSDTALRTTGGGVIDPAELFFDDRGDSILLQGGKYLFKDDDHLSKWGAMRLLPLLQRVLANPSDPAGEN